MSDRITVTMQDLRDAAKVFTARLGNIEEIIKELSDLNESLKGNWTGDSQVIFAQLSAERLNNLKDAVTEILPSISDILVSVADKMEGIDTEMANAMKTAN